MYQPRYEDGMPFGIWVLDADEAKERRQSAVGEFRDRLVVERDWAARQGMDSYVERLSVELELLGDSTRWPVRPDVDESQAA